MPTDRPTRVIGIAGETGSGKSTLCDRLLGALLPGAVQVLCLDSYYISQDHLSRAERDLVNYDHPDAFDIKLLIAQLDALSQGHDIRSPAYDFTQHARKPGTITMAWAPMVIVEGILALYWQELRARYDFAIYVQATEDTRLRRRVARDCVSRGRSRESVVEQWHRSVQTASREFCVPTKQYADLVFNGEAEADGEISDLLARLGDMPPIRQQRARGTSTARG